MCLFVTCKWKECLRIYDSVRRFTRVTSSSPLLIEVLTRSIIFWHVCSMYVLALSVSAFWCKCLNVERAAAH